MVKDTNFENLFRKRLGEEIGFIIDEELKFIIPQTVNKIKFKILEIGEKLTETIEMKSEQNQFTITFKF